MRGTSEPGASAGDSASASAGARNPSAAASAGARNPAAPASPGARNPFASHGSAVPPTSPARTRRRVLADSAIDKAVLLAVVASALLFIVYPLACMVGQSLEGGASASLALYAKVLARDAGLIWNSLFTGVLCAVLATAASLLVAACVVFGPKWASRAVMGILVVSMVSPPFVSSLAYIQLFGRRGLITHGLLGLSISPYGWVGVVIMQALFFMAINVLLLSSVMERIDRRTLQAAMDLGAPLSSVFWQVVVPLVRPALVVCLLLTFVRSIADYGTPVVIGGSFETVSTEIYMQVIGYADLGSAAVLNVLLLGMSVVVFIVYAYFMGLSDRMVARSAGSGVAPGSVRPSSPDEVGMRLRGGLGAAVYGVSALFFLVMVLQYFTIFHTAFTKGLGWDAPFSTTYLEHMLDYNLGSFERSLAYALAASVLGTLVGALVAYYTQRRRVPLRGPLEFIVTMPYMLPGTCFGLGYILAFNSVPLKLTGTAAIVVLSMVFKQLTISQRAFSTTMAQVSPTLDLAARDLGATRLGVLRDVLLPNVRNAFAVSFVNNFSSAMVTYSAVIFLVTPGHKIAVFELFDALSGGKYGQAAMIACFIIVVTVAVNVLFSAVLLRRKKGR